MLFADPNLQPKIHGGQFVQITVSGPPHAARRIVVFAENLFIGAVPLLARVGQQRVERLLPIAGGKGFTGILAREPSAGDRLYLHFIGRVPTATHVVFP